MGSSSGQQAGRWLSGPWAFLPGRALTGKSLEQPFVPDPLAVQVSLFPEGATGCVCFCSFLSVELETPKNHGHVSLRFISNPRSSSPFLRLPHS